MEENVGGEVMELRDLIFLGACALLAPEVRLNGFEDAADRIQEAVTLSRKVWEGTKK